LENIKSHIKTKRIQLRDSPLAELNKMEAVDVDYDENEDIVPVEGGKEDSAATTITH